MAPNFLSHEIRIVNNVLSIMYLSPTPPTTCFLLNDPNFCHWLFRLILFRAHPLVPLVIFATTFPTFLANSDFPSPSKRCPPAVRPLLALVCSSPPSVLLPLSSLITPLLVLHVCLLSSVRFFVLLPSILKFCYGKSFPPTFLFLQCFAYIRCSVPKLEDWKYADSPRFSVGWSR